MKATILMSGMFLLSAVAALSAERPNGLSSGASVSSELPYISEAVAARIGSSALLEEIEDPSPSGSSPSSTPTGGKKKKVKDPPGPMATVPDFGKSSHYLVVALLGMGVLGAICSKRSSSPS